MQVNLLEELSEYRKMIVISESDSKLNIIGFGNRNVSSIELNKMENRLLIKKIWPFFSDKIKFLFEQDTNVFFLNSENKFCITNSRNQAMIQILSEKILDQAIMYYESQSNKLFLIAECEKILNIFEISDSKIVNNWELNNENIVSKIRLRGNIFSVSTTNHILIIYLKSSNITPFNIIKIKPGYISVDVLSHSLDSDYDCLNLLGYKFSESGGHILSFNTCQDNSVIELLSFSEPSIAKSKFEFGKMLCFSGN